jgi:hypothetical protein
MNGWGTVQYPVVIDRLETIRSKFWYATLKLQTYVDIRSKMFLLTSRLIDFTYQLIDRLYRIDRLIYIIKVYNRHAIRTSDVDFGIMREYMNGWGTVQYPVVIDRLIILTNMSTDCYIYDILLINLLLLAIYRIIAQFVLNPLLTDNLRWTIHDTSIYLNAE